MNKNIKEVKKIDMENVAEGNEVLNEDEVNEIMKPKWSWKKKLLIGGGIVLGLFAGAIALGCKKSNTPVDTEVEDSEDDDKVIEENATVTEETPEKTEE